MKNGFNDVDGGMPDIVRHNKLVNKLFTDSKSAYAIINPAGFAFLNGAFLSALGYSEDSVHKIPFVGLFALTDVNVFQDLLTKIKEQKVVKETLDVLQADGQPLSMNIELERISLDATSSNILLLSAIATNCIYNFDKYADIHRLCSYFFDSSLDMISLKDEQSRFVFINQNFARVLGTTKKDLIGKTDYNFLSSSEADRCAITDKAALAAEGPLSALEVVNGRLYETHKFPVPLKNHIFGVGAFARDVTE